jgi:hypothetical protein
MRVAVMIGFLLFEAMGGLFEVGWIDLPTSEETGQVRATDGNYPPPPSFP